MNPALIELQVKRATAEVAAQASARRVPNAGGCAPRRGAGAAAGRHRRDGRARVLRLLETLRAVTSQPSGRIR